LISDPTFESSTILLKAKPKKFSHNTYQKMMRTARY